MTRLLVSVRDPMEAEAALEAGVDILDVKEPCRGSLGSVSQDTCRAILDVVESVSSVVNVPPLSLAMGELVDFAPEQFRGWPLALFSYAKLGLSGSANQSTWRKAWRLWTSGLPHPCRPVAVAYVDAAANCLPPEDLIREAYAADVRTLLLDTFRKTQGGLFDHVERQRLSRIRSLADKLSITLVIAGGLRSDDLLDLVAGGYELVGVRGAACEGDRCGTINAQRIRALQRILKAEGPKCSGTL